MTIPHIRVHQPGSSTPSWAVLQRQLFDLMNHSEDIILEHYLTPDGEIFWPDVDGFVGYGGVDNAFEGFHRWPLYYLLGGADRYGELAQRQYDTLVRQFSNVRRPNSPHPPGRDTMLVDDYLPDFDWMHAGEGAMYFYYLNLACPHEPINRERSVRFAGYLTGDCDTLPEPNYDSEHRVFRTYAMGSNGPAFHRFGPSYGYGTWMDSYGLAFYDVPGVTTMLDLQDPDKARRYGEVYNARLKHADTVTSLLSTSMAVNAWLHTGDDRFRQWTLDYVDGWRQRYPGEGHAMPDNAGPTGMVGETMEGRWYGGHYGWSFPPGFPRMGDALVVGGQSHDLLSGGGDGLRWVREQVQMLVERGFEDDDGHLQVPLKYADPDSVIEYGGAEPMTRPDRVTDHPGFNRKRQVDGWFHFRRFDPAYMAQVWSDSLSDSDWDLARASRGPGDTSAQQLTGSEHGKDYSGQQQAWMSFLCGGFPDFPEQALQASIDRVNRQLQRLHGELEGTETGWGYRPLGDDAWAQVTEVTRQVNAQKEADWSESVTHSYFQTYLIGRSTIVTEALVQLTMGGPLPVYNGGLLRVPIRHFDGDRRRPGLPPDVAALVHTVDNDGVALTLANLHSSEPRRVVVQAGAFGEHRFTSARWSDNGDHSEPIDGPHIEVELGPGTVVDLRLDMERHARRPSYAQPWDD